MQAKKGDMTLAAEDKQIFLFRKEASDWPNEGREVIPKESTSNLRISGSIQLEERDSSFVKPYTKEE